MSATDMSVTEPVIPTDTLPAQPERETAADRARAATRSRLIKSGKTLFAEHGLHQVTTHDIAFQAGVASGTFYNHFKDKSKLFCEITHAALNELSHRLDEVRDLGATHRERIQSQAEALVDFAAEHTEMIHILFSHEPAAAGLETDVLNQLAERILTERRAEIDTGEATDDLDPNILAQAMVGMWARVIAWWAEDPSRATRDQLVSTLTKIQLGGTHPA